MKPRNEALHAEIEKIANLKLQLPNIKALAEEHHSTVGSIRTMVSARLKELRKLTNVKIHVEPTRGKIEL